MPRLTFKTRNALQVGDWIWGTCNRNCWPETHGIHCSTPYQFTGDNAASYGLFLVGPDPWRQAANAPYRNNMDKRRRADLLLRASPVPPKAQKARADVAPDGSPETETDP